MTAHYVYDFLQAWADYHPERPQSILKSRSEPTTVWMQDAKMVVSWNGMEDQSKGGRHAIANLSKVGNLKIFDAEGPIASDTGLIGDLEDGSVAVTHFVQLDYIITRPFDLGADETTCIEGNFCCRKPPDERHEAAFAKRVAYIYWPIQRQPNPVHNTENGDHRKA